MVNCPVESDPESKASCKGESLLAEWDVYVPFPGKGPYDNTLHYTAGGTEFYVLKNLPLFPFTVDEVPFPWTDEDIHSHGPFPCDNRFPDA